MSLYEYGEGILRTHVTFEDVEKALETQQGESVSFGSNVTVKDIGEGNGYQSKIGYINADWKEPTTLPSRLVIKVNSQLPMAEYCAQEALWDFPNYEERFRTTHNREVDVYNLMEKYGGDSLRRAQAYATQKYSEENKSKGFLVMQYFPDPHSIHLIDNLDLRCMREILRSLAAFHVIGLKMDSKELDLLTYDVFNSFFGGFWTTEAVEKNLTILSDFMGVSAGNKINQLRQSLPLVISRQALEKLFTSTQRRNMTPVLCHGDLWGPNMLFSKKDDIVELSAFLDFQTSHMGNAAVDLAILFCTTLSGTDRRSSWMILLEEYYGCLRELVEGTMPFTLEQLVQSYHEFFPFAAYFTLDDIGGVYDDLTERNPNRHMPTRESVVHKVTCLLDDILLALKEIDKQTDS